MIGKSNAPPTASPRAHLRIGEKMALMNGDLSTADRELLECIRRAPLPERYRHLGVLYAQTRDTKKSVEYYEKYLDAAPNAPDADYIRGMLGGSGP